MASPAKKFNNIELINCRRPQGEFLVFASCFKGWLYLFSVIFDGIKRIFDWQVNEQQTFSAVGPWEETSSSGFQLLDVVRVVSLYKAGAKTERRVDAASGFGSLWLNTKNSFWIFRASKASSTVSMSFWQNKSTINSGRITFIKTSRFVPRSSNSHCSSISRSTNKIRVSLRNPPVVKVTGSNLLCSLFLLAEEINDALLDFLHRTAKTKNVNENLVFTFSLDSLL